MAIDRLVSLAIIALVAMIFPIMGQMPEERVPTDDELLTYLSYEGPSSEDFRPALESINAKEQIKIGGFTVASFLEAANNRERLLDDCKSVSFLESPEDIKDSDLTLVLNVFNVVNDHNEEIKKSCAEIIRNIFANIQLATKIRSNRPSDDELVAKLRRKSLLAWEIRIILKAIRDKIKIRIGGYSVRELLELEEHGHPDESHCRSYSFLNGPEGMRDSDLTLALNVFNFVNHRDGNLKESCAEILERNFHWSIRLTEIIGSHRFSDDQLIAKLREGEPENSDVRIILNAILDKDEIIIGRYSVKYFLELEEGGHAAESYCQSFSFLNGRQGMKSGDLTLALNVFNFVNNGDDALKKSCAKIITRNFHWSYRLIEIIGSHRFDDDKLIAKLREGKLEDSDVRIILNAIRYKSLIIIFDYSVGQLLRMEEDDIEVDYQCMFLRFPESTKELQDGDLTLALNLFNFVHNRVARVNEDCAVHIKANFAAARLVVALDAKLLTNDKIMGLFQPIENKGLVKIWIFTVERILDDASKDKPTISDCECNDFELRRDWEGGATLVKNIHNFIHFERLIPFCAENFRKVLNRAVTDTDKKLIRDFKEKEDNPVRKNRPRTRYDSCEAVEQHVVYIDYFISRDESDPYREDLEQIKSELAELKDLCKSK